MCVLYHRTAENISASCDSCVKDLIAIRQSDSKRNVDRGVGMFYKWQKGGTLRYIQSVQQARGAWGIHGYIYYL